jgi:hypothetical protein
VRPLSIEPDFIDFGCLKPGLSARKLLRVQGGPARVIINSGHVKIVPSEVGNEIAELEITAVGGEEGDLIWDSIQIEGIGGKMEVPVTGYWYQS